VQTGTIALEKPGRMAWIFTGAQEFLSDGSSLWVVDPRDRTCTVYRGLNAVLSRYFAFLTGLADVRQDYTVSLGDDGALKLVPKDAHDTMGVIEVRFDASSGLVSSLRVTNPFGDQTEVVLSNVRTGRDIPDESFTYTARDGFRTIEGG
jgi:outer membrane lipoprotein-sorting protein